MPVPWRTADAELGTYFYADIRCNTVGPLLDMMMTITMTMTMKMMMMGVGRGDT